MVKSMRRVLILIAMGLAASASADTLLLEGISMDAATADLRPRRGMSMESVEARFGSPTTRTHNLLDATEALSQLSYCPKA